MTETCESCGCDSDCGCTDRRTFLTGLTVGACGAIVAAVAVGSYIFRPQETFPPKAEGGRAKQETTTAPARGVKRKRKGGKR